MGLATGDKIPAGERLRAEIGDELADRLIASLRQDAGSVESDSVPPAAEPGRAA